MTFTGKQGFMEQRRGESHIRLPKMLLRGKQKWFDGIKMDLLVSHTANMVLNVKHGGGSIKLWRWFSLVCAGKLVRVEEGEMDVGRKRETDLRLGRSFTSERVRTAQSESWRIRESAIRPEHLISPAAVSIHSEFEQEEGTQISGSRCAIQADIQWKVVIDPGFEYLCNRQRLQWNVLQVQVLHILWVIFFFLGG